MKKSFLIYALSIILLSIFACKKDERIVPQGTACSLSERDTVKLNIQKALQLAPNAYFFENKNLIFKNKRGEELLMKKRILPPTTYENDVKIYCDADSSKVKTKTYISNFHFISYSDTLGTMHLELYAGNSASVDNKNDLIISEDLIIQAGANTGHTFHYINIGYDNGKARHVYPAGNPITLLGKQYENVHSSINDRTSYAQLHYSTREGVVGFSDRYNDLWLFDRFE